MIARIGAADVEVTTEGADVCVYVRRDALAYGGGAARIILSRTLGTVAESIAAWALSMRGQLDDRGQWASRHCDAGAWVLSAEAFPGATVWYATIRDGAGRHSITVAYGKIDRADSTHDHNRVARESMIEARAAVLTAAYQWVDDASSALTLAATSLFSVGD